MADTLIIEENAAADTGYKFSWGLAIAGGVVASAVTFFLLSLGAGFGLMLVSPLSNDNPSVPAFLTGGAIYFVASLAFGFAVGGYMAGRLLGPIAETTREEEFRAGAHGFVAWAVAVLATATMVALGGMAALHGGMTAAALYGASPATQDKGVTSYVVDRLFRPAAAPAGASAPDTAAREEAGRIVEASMMVGSPVAADDRTRLVALTQAASGASPEEAATRVDATTVEVTTKAKLTAEIARKVAAYASLWIAAALIFGALVASAAAVFARIEDDKREARILTRRA